MKFSLKAYYKPTPAKIRKWADAFLGACSTISVWPITSNCVKIGAALIIIGFIAKVISNGFTDDAAPQ